jgi:hypothetical protein
MTTPTPPPEEENLPKAPATETPPRTTGFFNRVQQELQPQPIHPTEEAEIVIMDEDEGDR